MAVTNAALQRQIAEHEEFRSTIVQRALAMAERRGMTGEVEELLRGQGFDIPVVHHYTVQVARTITIQQVKYVDVRATDQDAAREEALTQARNNTGNARRAYWDNESSDEYDNPTVRVSRITDEDGEVVFQS